MIIVTLEEVYDAWYKMKNYHYMIDEEMENKFLGIGKMRLPMDKYYSFSMKDLRENFSYFCDFVKFIWGYKIY